MTREDLVEACARAAHEAMRSYCTARGDTSFASWENADEWQRSVTRTAVAVVRAMAEALQT